MTDPAQVFGGAQLARFVSSRITGWPSQLTLERSAKTTLE